MIVNLFTAISLNRFSEALILVSNSWQWLVAFCVFYCKLIVIRQSDFSQIIERLCHLFQVENLGPTFISKPFPSTQLCLNIYYCRR